MGNWWHFSLLLLVVVVLISCMCGVQRLVYGAAADGSAGRILRVMRQYVNIWNSIVCFWLGQRKKKIMAMYRNMSVSACNVSQHAQRPFSFGVICWRGFLIWNFQLNDNFFFVLAILLWPFENIDIYRFRTQQNRWFFCS